MILKLTLVRQQRGWSKARLARTAGLDQSLVSKVESGRIRPYPSQLTRIAEALSWPVDTADELLCWVTMHAANDDDTPVAA